MSSPNLKIKIKFGNNESSTESNVTSPSRPQDAKSSSKQAKSRVRDLAAREEAAQRAIMSGSSLVVPRAIMAGSVGVIVIATLIFVFTGGDDEKSGASTVAQAPISTNDNLAKFAAPSEAKASKPPLAEAPLATPDPAQLALESTAGSNQTLSDAPLTTAKTDATPTKSTDNAAPTVTAPATPSPVKDAQVKPVSTREPALAKPANVAAAKTEPEKKPAKIETKNVTAPTQTRAAGKLARAQLTSDIQNREPVDALSGTVTLENSPSQQVFFFTELRDFKDRQVSHRWEHDGKVVADVELKIGSQAWRTYSSKNLASNDTGHWRVSVVDDTGKTLHVTEFQLSQ